MFKDLRCYCCGTNLGAEFALVFYPGGADRVFVMLPEHVEKVADAKHITVHRARKPPMRSRPSRAP